MNSRFLLWVFLLLAVSCHRRAFRSSSRSSLQGYRISYTLPIIESDGSDRTQVEYYNVYYKGRGIVYEYRYQFDSSENGKLLSSVDRNAYFITHLDSAYGFYFDPAHHALYDGKRMKKDSAMRRVAFGVGNWSAFYTKAPDSSTRARNTQHFTETYHLPADTRSSLSSTVSFEYNARFAEVPESLEPVLDSTRRAKLVRISVAFPAGYDPRYKMTFPPRIFVIAITSLNVKYPARLETYFALHRSH